VPQGVRPSGGGGGQDAPEGDGHDVRADQEAAEARHKARLVALLGARQEQIEKERALDEAAARAEPHQQAEPREDPELTEPVSEEPPPYRLHPKYFPQLVLDLTGPRMEVSYRGDPERVIAETKHAQARVPTGPRVIDYVEVKEDMLFCQGASYVTLPVGRVVELVQPSERDRKDLERFGKEKKPHTVIRWNGLTRTVPSRCLARVPESAWLAQQKKEATT